MSPALGLLRGSNLCLFCPFGCRNPWGTWGPYLSSGGVCWIEALGVDFV